MIKSRLSVLLGLWATQGGMTRIHAKIYHKPIESLHRPAEAMAEEAKTRVINT
jgi:hypothetical protein